MIRQGKKRLSEGVAAPACPRCGSARTERLAQFASTACKALYRCVDCREPFDYFKPY
ncbi:PaaD-like zinc ribbon domain-containing protein [Burkholderia contaminans]|uniref:PaaD-like zinc ribbon domain-containing protein n=1 Tax=Burkholderia contaminans TaxID=488447 RepID=UPI0040469FB0